MNIGVYGSYGEGLAIAYLKKSGYKILTANYTKKVGEVDIIALETKKARKKRPEYKEMSKEIQKEDVLVFVEVKSRNSTKFGRPSEAVDKQKKKHYETLANNFRLLNPKFAGLPFRLDIIEVIETSVDNHIINAF